MEEGQVREQKGGKEAKRGQVVTGGRKRTTETAPQQDPCALGVRYRGRGRVCRSRLSSCPSSCPRCARCCDRRAILMVSLRVGNMRLSLHCYPAPVGESSKARCHTKNTQPCYQKRSNAIAGHFELMLNGSGAARGWIQQYSGGCCTRYTYITDLRREVGGVRNGNYRTG